MRRPSSIIVVGSSGNGKTTLVNGLRAHGDQFVFPKRFITRPRRKGDDLIENEHVRSDKFDRLLETGGIDVAWSRPLGKTRTERYGFESLNGTGRITVYSANNALLRDQNAMVPPDFFEDCFIVLVKAPDDIRRDRMFGRSPDIAHEEMDIRIRDNGLDLVPKAHLVIDTHSFRPDHAVALVRRSVGKLE